MLNDGSSELPLIISDKLGEIERKEANGKVF
jgi:hypothetical protein